MAGRVTCAGGGLIPDWLPEGLHWLVSGSQGITSCFLEWTMLIEGILVMVVLLALLSPRRLVA